MSITDELRDWFKDRMFMGNGWQEIHDIADRIDVEHERVVRERRRSCVYYDPERHYCSCHDFDVSGYVELPKDADGEYIHIGDVMDGTCPSGKHVNGTVNAIGDGVFWLSNVQFSLKPDYMHHYHAPTVEDVLREFFSRYVTTKPKDEDDAILAEYAAKLRLAKEDA